MLCLKKDSRSLFLFHSTFSRLIVFLFFLRTDMGVFGKGATQFLQRHRELGPMVFVFIALIIPILAASSAPSVLMSVVPSGIGRFGLFIAGITISLLMSFILFEVIYWLIPNKKMSLKVTWCGALVAACILEIFIILFPLYVRRHMNTYKGTLFIEAIY